MPAAAWATLVIAALIIAITALGLLRVIFHLRATLGTLRHRSGRADLGQRQPEAGPRLLRNSLSGGRRR
jgi:hypothetical protein